MKKIINHLKEDELFGNLLWIKMPIDRFTFLTFYLLRMVLLFCLYQILPSLVMLPVTFWFVYNLIGARLWHISNGLKGEKMVSAVVVFFITIFIYMSLTMETMFSYYIPLNPMLRDDLPTVKTIMTTVNLTYAICGVFSLIVVIILSCIKGKSEKDNSIVIKMKLPPFLSGLLKFRGSISRVEFIYKSLIISLFSMAVMLIVFFSMRDLNSLFQAAFFFIWIVIVIIMISAVTTQRLHDLKRSGWWTPAYFILIILYVALHPTLFQLSIISLITIKFGASCHIIHIIYNLYIYPIVAHINSSIRFMAIVVIFYLYLYPGKRERGEKKE